MQRAFEAAHDAAALLAFDDCNQRLVQTLLRFSRTAAATPQEGGEVVLSITHQQLAQPVGDRPRDGEPGPDAASPAEFVAHRKKPAVF